VLRAPGALNRLIDCARCPVILLRETAPAP